MIIIVIHAYEICTQNVIKLIVCLEPGRRIDRHAYREDTVAAAYSQTDIESPFGSMT